MAGEDRRIEAARRLVAHLADVLDADLTVRLWTGERLPLGRNPPSGDLALAVNDPRAITRLIRRPRFATLVELLACGDLDIEGGTLIDVAHRRGRMRTKGLWRRLDKKLVLRALAPFLFGSASAPKGEQAYGGRVAGEAAKGRDDKALIGFHYDLSNAFYALFLDPRMVYTCAYFADPGMSLEEAQLAKLDMICRKLRLKPGERFLDIGCGWGALVLHAAQHYGVEALGVTLSEEQHALANARIAEPGLGERVKVELRDYRSVDEPGAFDKIASIGMFEHVGIDNHDAYFTQMRTLLRPGGLYLHHAIARPAKRDMTRFRRQRAEYKALTTYIFPGGELDTLGMSVNALERNGFEVHDVEGWREHYQRTCREWAQALHANRDKAAAEVGPAKTRLWLIYLAGCSLAFERGAVGSFQTLASRKAKGPGGAVRSQVPPSRADLYSPGAPQGTATTAVPT
ncbi:MAG: SAM-dependent methyltransferase [Hyphomicrobiales bacterium]|nr:SAM-dependent methyltransferase [Hyphomicrobiales bacterium]